MIVDRSTPGTLPTGGDDDEAVKPQAGSDGQAQDGHGLLMPHQSEEDN